MKRTSSRILFGNNTTEFLKYPELEFHKVLDNASIYVAGDEDQYTFIVSNEWESRLTEVGEYKNEL